MKDKRIKAVTKLFQELYKLRPHAMNDALMARAILGERSFTYAQVARDALTVLYEAIEEDLGENPSNGARIMQFKEVIAKTMNHVNISRHAIGYAANVPIFKTKKIIEDGDLKELCSYLNSQGVDVNLNHVYTKEGPQLTKDYVHNYVAYAKMLGANSVSFRYDQSENSLDETYLEAFFKDFKVVNRGGCPVCRNHTILIDGLQVVFKASFVEPSVTIKDVYELIFHIDGRLCTDWGGKDEFTPKKAVEYKIKHNTETLPPLNTNDMFGGLIRPAEERRRVYIQSEPIVERNYGGGCGASNRGGGCS